MRHHCNLSKKHRNQLQGSRLGGQGPRDHAESLQAGSRGRGGGGGGAGRGTFRRALELRWQVLDTAARFMRPGVTGDEIDRVVYQDSLRDSFAPARWRELVWGGDSPRGFIAAEACIDRKIYPSPLRLGCLTAPLSVPVRSNSSAAEELLSLPQDALRLSERGARGSAGRAVDSACTVRGGLFQVICHGIPDCRPCEARRKGAHSVAVLFTAHPFCPSLGSVRRETS